MKIQFLGTGAADWKKMSPGEEYRRYTSTLIDDAMLIDVTETVLDQIPDPAQIHDVLFTHSHADHFSLDALLRLAPCRVYAHKSWAHIISGEGLEVTPVEVGVPVTLPNGCVVMPMPSNHATTRADEVTLHYLIERAGKRLFYATDGAWLRNEEHRLLGESVLDAVVFDATIGDMVEGDYRIFEHNSVDMIRLMVKTMRKTGRLRAEAPVFLTHLARTLHAPQHVLEQEIEKPMVVCYDGMTITI